MKNFINKIKWKIQDLKRLPKATYLCWKYPFLKHWNRKNRFFQTYCEYYAIPYGWRKAFGLQMIKEINDALLRHGGKKAVKNYSIDQIKEKFGSLQWYDSNSNTEVWKICEKYESISSYTCIECGKLATVRTTGWICPYCDDCVGDRAHIHFGHKNGPSWYGWTGNIDRIPDDIWNAEEEMLNKKYGINDSSSSEEAPA